MLVDDLLCDFILGERTTEQTHRYMLCEINISSVSSLPPSAIEPPMKVVKARLLARQSANTGHLIFSLLRHHRADAAMYLAKALGRNAVRFSE